MKFVGLTLRVDKYDQINECRDAIDQRWYKFLHICGITPILIPNNEIQALNTLSAINISGVIFSGGNDLGYINDELLVRDEVETAILSYSIKNNLPVIGVCRGMQFIQKYFGTKVDKVDNHTKTSHSISFGGEDRVVNSYHNYGTIGETRDFRVVARSQDNIIESIEHNNLPIKAIMWHPEREEEFHPQDIEMFKEHFTI